MEYFPIFLDLKDAKALVVGGGMVATRKAEQLVGAGARVTVVSPRLTASLKQYGEEDRIDVVETEFSERLLEGCTLAIAATDDRETNRRVSEACRARYLPVNVVDNPSLCTFITPAIVDRSPLVIALSTGGTAPVLARRLKASLESMIPAAYGGLARMAGEYRSRVRNALSGSVARRRFWESVFEGPVAENMLAGRRRRAWTLMEEALRAAGTREASHGEVYLVGGGPGDPDLLTFRALRLMQQADVVLYDRLVSSEVLALARRDAERIYVGKKKSRHAVPQDGINDLMVELASDGQRVLRLKGGDPFTFGRGGEEIETLAEHGIPFQVVPGITAAEGCAAYAGIPLTHRDLAHSVQFVTAHPRRDGKLTLDWEALSKPDQTLVFYMGRTVTDRLCAALMAHGLPADYPAALVERGTTPRQQVLASTLDKLPRAVEAAGVDGPSLIIVGKVVRLHKRLAWFEPTTDKPNFP